MVDQTAAGGQNVRRLRLLGRGRCGRHGREASGTPPLGITLLPCQPPLLLAASPPEPLGLLLVDEVIAEGGADMALVEEDLDALVTVGHEAHLDRLPHRPTSSAVL